MTRITKRTSQYLLTPDVNQIINYLDIWVPRPIESSDNDTLVRIESKYNRRPDLMSFDLYGTPNLWWIFAVRNPDSIEDPIEDHLSGVEIFLPSRRRVEDLV